VRNYIHHTSGQVYKRHRHACCELGGEQRAATNRRTCHACFHPQRSLYVYLCCLTVA